MAKNNNHKAVSYNKWGYIFLIPFVVVYLIFQLVPLISTIYNSFFENYRSGLTQIGPNFVGLANYAKLFQGGDIWIYFKNTMQKNTLKCWHRCWRVPDRGSNFKAAKRQ